MNATTPPVIIAAATPESGSPLPPALIAPVVSPLDQIDLSRLMMRARELRYWIIGVIALSLVIALIATMLQTPQYAATSRIEINRVDTGSANIDEFAIEGETRDMQYYQTQYQLLQSRFLAERVVEARNLSRDPATLEAFGMTPETQVDEATLAQILLGSVQVEPVGESNLVDVTFSSGSPEVSAMLANNWAVQFLEANLEKRFGNTIQAREQLERQLAEMRDRLQTSEAELINYANANEMVVLQTGSSGDGDAGSQTLVASQLGALNSALTAATSARIAAESSRRAGADVAGAASGVDAAIAQAEGELARARVTFGPDNPRVQALQAQLSTLRSAENRQSADQNRDRQATVNQARLAEAELQRRFNAARDRYLLEQRQGVRYGILQREVDTNRELYDALLQRFKQLGVGGAGQNNMTLVEEAQPPGGPYKPSLMQNLLIAFAIGLGLAGAMVLLREFLDQTVRDPADVQKRLGVPLLGLIPTVDREQLRDQLADQHSTLNEAYSSTRASLGFTLDPDDKVILITSTVPEEGKTITSVAIARNWAKLGKKVLLIDLDLRRRGSSRYFDMGANRGGMAEYLANPDQVPEPITADEFGFDFIPSGRMTSNAADLLGTPRIGLLLEQFKRDYDYVVLDAPPVLGLADSPQLAKSSDGLVYVIRANGSNWRMIRQAMARLSQGNSRVYGVVLTHLDERNQAYGYGYGYGYGYTYEAKPD